MSKDITERKKIEGALKESEKKYRDLVDNALVGIYQTSIKGEILYVNEALLRMLEYKSLEDLASRGILKTYKNSKVRELFIKKLKKTGKVKRYEIELLTKAGKTKNVLLGASLAGDVITGMMMDITDRKQVRDALWESERRFRQFFENEPEYCYMISLDGRILDINSSALTMLDYKKEEIIGKPLLTTIYAPSSREKAKELFMKWKKTGKLRNEELNIITKTGENRTVLLSVDAVRSANGKLLHSISIQRDITERKKAGEELRKSEDKFRTFMETASDLMQIVDKDGNFTYVNESTARNLGYSKEEMIGMHITQVLDTETLKNFKANFKELIKKGKIGFEDIWVAKDGKKIYGELIAVAIYDSDGKFAGARLIFRDITERKKAGEALQEEKNKLHAIIEAMEYGLTIQDRDYNIIYQNEVLKKIFGRLGEKCYRVYEGKNRVCDGCPVKMAFKDGKSHTSERRVTMPSGEIAYWDNTANLIRNTEGEIVACLEITRNITERKQAEQVLKETKAFLDNIIQSAPDAIITVDLKDRITSFSPGAEELFGYKTKDIMGGSVFRLYLQGREKRGKGWKEKLLKGEDVRVETKQVKADGGVVDVKLSMSPLRDGKGDIAGIVSISHDITERKQAERELKRKMEELERFTKLAVGRELKMVELKKRIKDLEEKLESEGDL